MSLIDAYSKRCCFMNKIKKPDGAGGFIVTWTDGEEFDCAITQNTTLEAQIAEKQGITSTYNVTCSKKALVEYYDVIKVLETGETFRITSNGERRTPKSSALDIVRYTAEKYVLV